MKGNVLVLLGLAALLSACGKLTLVNAPREKEGISLVENAHYDSESKIRYMVSNDNSRVYLRFDTDNFATIMRVRKLGAIVRFDTQGKRKGTHWLKYPNYGDTDIPAQPSSDIGAMPGGIRKSDLFPPSTTAIWAIGENSKHIDLGLNTEGFLCQAGLDDKDVLVYVVGIPFSVLGGQHPEDFSNLNMALEIPSPDAGTRTSNSSDPSTSIPGSMNSGVPGSMNSNMPGTMQGMPSRGAMGSGGSVPVIKIWMQVKLSPTSAQ